VHIVGTKAKVDIAPEEAMSNGGNAKDSAGRDNGNVAAAAQPEQCAEADMHVVSSGEAAHPNVDVGGTQSRPASEAAADPANNSKEGEEQSAHANEDREAAALDTATAAADVLHVEDIWDFKRRQATWHSLT